MRNFRATVLLDDVHHDESSSPAFPRRCAGSHLARRELLIATEEWHTLIPDYEIDTTEPLVEHGWQLGLDAVPLRWSRQR